MVTIDDVRAFAGSLPRAYEALVRDRVKFRVGRIVFLAFSRDEQVMGFGFPKEERAALVAAEPDKFLMPLQSDMRYQWVRVRLAAIDGAEMRELVLDSWRMCVPKRVAAEYLAAQDLAAQDPARGRGSCRAGMDLARPAKLAGTSDDPAITGELPEERACSAPAKAVGGPD
jgi:hypothetical protein